MITMYYEVVVIDGDYAHLKRTDVESEELKIVARALLPSEINEGDGTTTAVLQPTSGSGFRPTWNLCLTRRTSA